MPAASQTAVADRHLADRLREHGHRVTAQRLVLHRVLCELGRHVTADEVLQRAGERLPALSLPTVYATLELLEDLGLLRRVSNAGGAVLFDPRTDPHHHLRCRRCRRTTDLDARVDLKPAVRLAQATGALVEGAELVLVGVCPDCRATESGF